MPPPPPDDRSEPAPGRDRAPVLAETAARRLHPGPSGNAGVDRITALAARIIGAPAALVSLVSDIASIAGSSGVPSELRVDRPLGESLAAMAATTARPLVVTDARADPRTQGYALVDGEHIGSFLGVPMTGDNGQIIGALCVYDPRPRIWAQSDLLTLQELAGAAANELELSALVRDYDVSRARWDLAIEAAGIGNFDWDLQTGRLLWDEQLITMFGYDGDEQFGQTIEDFNARLHPDDLPHVGQAIERAIAGVGDYEAEYRVLLPDGRTRWLQARGRALGRNGVSERLLGAAWDVSATRGARDRAAQIVASMPVGYLSLDTTKRVLAVNNVAERMLKRTRSMLVGHALRDAVPAGVGEPIATACTRVARSVQPEDVEIHLDGNDGRWLEASIWPDINGVAVYLSDITGRKLEQQAMKRSAEHDKSVAIALQDAMLSKLPTLPDVELEARYLTAAAQDKVGGDWYDALGQPSGATMVTVGDVVGHDITAAAVMGQVRTMLRAFAWERDDSPAAIVSRLDRAIHDLYPGVMATAVTARIEPSGPAAPCGSRLLRWTNAGHPPPILVRPDGSVAILEREIDLLLGVDASLPRFDHVTELRPGDVVVLYTDGLVETRGASLDAGIEALVDSLRRHRALPTGALLDAVLTDTVGDTPGDDVAVLAIRIATGSGETQSAGEA